MALGDIPISVIEDLEISAGATLDVIFNQKKPHPKAKRVSVFLHLYEKGEKQTWEQLGLLTMDQLAALMVDVEIDNPKD